jgi:hypothetical protein
VAALRCGLIGFSCEKCNEAPYIKDTLGCDKPMEIAATWLGPDEEFYNCPIRFIMQNSCELLEKMDSYKTGLSTPPDFENHSAKFLLGVKVFDHYYRKLDALKKGE